MRDEESKISPLCLVIFSLMLKKLPGFSISPSPTLFYLVTGVDSKNNEKRSKKKILKKMSIEVRHQNSSTLASASQLFYNFLHPYFALKIFRGTFRFFDWEKR
jgi:hypothetical protein